MNNQHVQIILLTETVMKGLIICALRFIALKAIA